MNEVRTEQSAKSDHKLKRIMQQLDNFFKDRYEVHFNVLSERTEFRDIGSNAPYQPIGRRDVNRLIIEALYDNIDCMDRDVYRYLQSSFIPESQPMKDYIDQLPEWDRRDRIVELAKRISSVPTWITLFHRWMLGMVAQWTNINPIHGNALMPILISKKQGHKKSTFCRLILPEELRLYYTDEFDINSRSSYVNKISKFALINIDEFNRMGEVKAARLKNLLQMADIKVKGNGGGYERKQRIASFIGTSNFKELLTDPTGSRRFIPIEQFQKIARLKINYRQLYAQLRHELHERKRYWLNTREESSLTKRNLSFTRRPIEENLFFECFSIAQEGDKSYQKLSISQLYETLRRKSPSTMRDIKMAAFGEHLAILNVPKVRTSAGFIYMVKKVSEY